MSNNHFSIKSRIFKRERVRESEDNLVIVPKTKQTENKNQVEFIWSNNELEQDHLKIVGRVVIKEWERLLTAFPIHRAFIQVRDSGRIHFFVSFEVKNNLTSDEIKKIISTAVSILNECLEKVTKKVFGPEKSRVASIEKVPVVALVKENESSIVNTEREDALIKKLHTEIEQQEILLQKLAKQHENKKEMAVDSTVPVVEPKKDLKNEELVELINKNELLNKKNEELQEKLSKSKKINHELDKVNLKLSSVIEENKVSAARLENVDEIEQRLQELQKENSDYRVQCMESQSLIDQYNNKNDHLNESLEKMKLNQAEMLEQAQADYLNLDENLKESQKKLILETNERQKLEIHIEDVRKKLAESILNNQEKDKEIKGLIIDVKNQEEFNEEKVGEIHTLKSSLDELKVELQMSYATNEVLVEKNTALEAQGEKLKQIDEWQEKYELLQEKYDELGQEAFGYRQEVSLLKSQFNQLEAKLTNVPLEDIEPVSIFEHKTIKKSPVEKVEVEEIKETVELVVEKPAEIIEEQHEDSYDDDYEYEDFSYESDPYVEEVVSEELMNIRKVDQVKEEKRIQELLESYKEDTFRDIKVSKEEYRQHVLEFKFLNFRWSQVFIMEDADKNTAFLEWCAPYIEKIETFEEELSFDVKKSFFMKNYVTMDESTFNILKGYSKLSSYLDTYYLKLSFYIDKYFLNEGNR